MTFFEIVQKHGHNHDFDEQMFELKLNKLSFFCWAIMEQMCEWGLSRGAGRTEEEVDLCICIFLVDLYVCILFFFGWLIFVFVFVVFYIRHFNPQVEGWVVSRRVKRGEEATCPVCLEDLQEGEQVENSSSWQRSICFLARLAQWLVPASSLTIGLVSPSGSEAMILVPTAGEVSTLSS